ncbi:MAG: glycosyltransferase family 39 protein [Bernardetiaceae bacterium]|jgi:4-amino-4-deoxy-L-arabinose transferase-like glycosyltransferase|nr:glycosyltransferase family 39 protein [Bernardetiaceae bacterium]
MLLPPYVKEYGPFVALAIVCLAGMFIDVMDIDEAQYASIGLEMAQTGSYLEVYHRGQDYLDKPPLLFWVSALVFNLFGPGNFTYRLVPVLVCGLGLYATYRLARLFYPQKTAYLAALMAGTSYSVLLANHDVRTDTMLMGWAVFALWQLAAYLQTQHWGHLLLGGLGVGLAMLAKGPIGFMICALALGTHLGLGQQWRQLFRWQWLVAVGVAAVVLLPMGVGLYTQFDAQPQKLIEGERNTSGLYFFFWKQSFGRLTGENVWKDDSDPFFFVHTYLWSVLPWGLLTVLAFGHLLTNTGRQVWRQWFGSSIVNKENKEEKNRLTNPPEYLTLGGFLLPFVALSMSQYKLPHYINIVIPLSSVFCAHYVHGLLARPGHRAWLRVAFGLQWLHVVIIWAVGLAVALWMFPLANAALWAVMMLGLLATLYLGFKGQTRFQRLILPSVTSILTLYLMLNAHFYPQLVQYQAGSVLGKYLARQTDFPLNRFFMLHRISGDGKDIFPNTVDFYSGDERPLYTHPDSLLAAVGGRPAWLYLDEQGLAEMKQRGQVTILRGFDKWHVTQLTPEFLNPATRLQVTNRVYLVAFVPGGRPE